MPLDKPCWFYISAATVTTYALIFHSQCFVNSSSQRLSGCRCQSRDVYIFGNETFHFTKPWKLDMNHVPCMWGKTLYTATKLINVLLLHSWQCGTNLVPRHPSQFSKAVWAWVPALKYIFAIQFKSWKYTTLNHSYDYTFLLHNRLTTFTQCMSFVNNVFRYGSEYSIFYQWTISLWNVVAFRKAKERLYLEVFEVR